MNRAICLVLLLAPLPCGVWGDDSVDGVPSRPSLASDFRLAVGQTVVSSKHVETKNDSGKHAVILSGDVTVNFKGDPDRDFVVKAQSMRLENLPVDPVTGTVDGLLGFSAAGTCRFATGSFYVTADRIVLTTADDKPPTVLFSGNVKQVVNTSVLEAETLSLTLVEGKWAIGSTAVKTTHIDR